MIWIIVGSVFFIGAFLLVVMMAFWDAYQERRRLRAMHDKVEKGPR